MQKTNKQTLYPKGKVGWKIAESRKKTLRQKADKKLKWTKRWKNKLKKSEQKITKISKNVAKKCKLLKNSKNHKKVRIGSTCQQLVFSLEALEKHGVLETLALVKTFIFPFNFCSFSLRRYQKKTLISRTKAKRQTLLQNAGKPEKWQQVFCL